MASTSSHMVTHGGHVPGAKARIQDLLIATVLNAFK